MAAIELSPISEHFSASEVEALEDALADVDAAPLCSDDQAQTVFVASDIDDVLFAELRDRLEVHEAACTVYVPADFEDSFKIGAHQVGSASMLLLVLAEIKEELSIDDDDDGDADPDEDYADDEGPMLEDEIDNDAFDLKEKQLREVWELLNQGATTCIDDSVCMFLTP